MQQLTRNVKSHDFAFKNVRTVLETTQSVIQLGLKSTILYIVAVRCLSSPLSTGPSSVTVQKAKITTLAFGNDSDHTRELETELPNSTFIFLILLSEVVNSFQRTDD